MTERRTSVGFILLFLLAVLTQTGCGLVPENVSLSDSRVQPLLKAMEQVDRPSLGFTPVTTNAQIKLETHSLAGSYDAMLHVYGATSRTIAFRKTATGYRWTAEQEIYQGPKWWQTMDGTFREEMIIEYQTERVNGIPTNQLSIRYQGSDTNLEGREFTLAEVRPILEKWKTSPVESQPPDLPGAGFDPAPAMFMLFMLLALLVGCCLALIIGAMCVAIVAVMLAGGIVSASVLIGILRRSVSAGFRALIIQLGAVAGMAGGAIATCVVTLITKARWNSPSYWIIGIILGLFAGILFAWVINRIWGRVVQALTQRLENRN
ncbi:MAG: hypothetical protein JWR19_2480 [Pedosphaera sp.]|nr:hypothetical protein [Pedosphaera sp.]